MITPNHRKFAMVAPHRSGMSRSTLHEELIQVRQRLKSANRFVVEPQSREVHRWDIVTMFALIFIAVIVPFEVAFLEWRAKFSVLFLLNRSIDFILICDLILHFFLAYHDKSRGNILIKNRHLIRKRYLATWFLPDLISSVPFDGFFFAIDRYEPLNNLISPRAAAKVRLLRLLRLYRVRRIVQIQRRYEVYAAFSLSYTTVGIMRLMCMLITFVHWIGCLWGLIANKELVGADSWTWVHERADDLCIKIDDSADGCRKQFDKGSALQIYITSLYFAIYTMTGIGYGDVHATNFTETAACVLLMFISAMFWAFTIGSFCHLVRSMDIQESLFRRRVDDLNRMMADRKFPRDLRQRCRLFLINSRQQQKRADYSRLESLFSYSLRSDVATTMNRFWLDQVYYLQDASKEFIVRLSEVMTSVMYAPMEVIEVKYSLVILQSGIVARAGRIYSNGAIWGKEFLMREVDLIDSTIAAALSYALIVFVHRDDVYDILEDKAFDKERDAVESSCRFYALKMRICKFGKHISKRHAALSRVTNKTLSKIRPAYFGACSTTPSVHEAGLYNDFEFSEVNGTAEPHTANGYPFKLAPLKSKAVQGTSSNFQKAGKSSTDEFATLRDQLDAIGDAILGLDLKMESLRKELKSNCGSTNLEMSRSWSLMRLTQSNFQHMRIRSAKATQAPLDSSDAEQDTRYSSLIRPGKTDE